MPPDEGESSPKIGETVGLRLIRSRQVYLSILLVLVFFATVWITIPLWGGLMFGTMLAFTAQPLYRRLCTILKGRRALAGILTTVLGGVVALVGVALAGYVILHEALLLLTLARKQVSEGTLESVLGERILRLLESLGIERETLIDRFRDLLTQMASFAAELAGMILQRTTGALLMLVISVFSMYYMLLEWPRLAARLERLLPLDPRHTRALVQEFRDVARAAFIGTVATAIAQGIFASIGYALVGVPEPIAWGIVTGLGSFIPVVGTAMVWVPVAVYLAINGHPWKAVIILTWGALVVMAVSDYIVRPRLAGTKSEQPILLMLIALLGGLEVFGLPGLVAGPIVMSLFLAILRIYERDLPS